LDGVLVDSRKLHYEALNRALAIIGEEYKISPEEQKSTYEGLPTSQESFDKVWKLKQEFTQKIVDEEFEEDKRLIYCASNSILFF
jgi:beta-phosphoglucomutase-like phosphatase (HAD superfamily)